MQTHLTRAEKDKLENMNIEDKEVDIMSTIFQHEFILDEEINIDSVEEWDSINHLELIVTLEEEFGIKIPHDIAVNLHSKSQIVQAIKDLKK